MNRQQKEKNELIELFGIHFETYYHLPPCASRILGILILSSRTQGMTFEDLVENGNASKSTISTNINLLLKLEKINYYTLPGDRKKYFRPSPLSKRILNHLRFIDAEKKMVGKVREYEMKYQAQDEYSERKRKTIDTYMKYLLAFENLLNKSIQEKELNENIF